MNGASNPAEPVIDPPDQNDGSDTLNESDVTERASRFTSFIFVCPPLERTIPFILLLAALLGFSIQRDAEGALWGLVGGLGLALTTLIVTPPLVTAFKGNLYLRHGGLAILVSLALGNLVLGLGHLIRLEIDYPLKTWLAYAIGVGAAFWYLILRGLALPSWWTWPLSILPFLVQGLIMFMGLFVVEDLQFLLLALLLLPPASLALMHIVDGPFQHTFGVTGSELIQHFIAYYGRDERTLEEVLSRLGHKADLQVGVAKFQRPGADKPFLTMVIPTHHPGPVGELGGSNLPFRLAEQLREEAGEVMAIHGASINDHNPLQHECIPRLAHAVTDCLPDIKTTPSASRPIWVGTNNGCVGQRIGNGTLLLCLPEPKGYDDVEPAIGRQAEALGHIGLEGPCVFGDCHSQLAVNAPHLVIEDPRATDLLQRVGQVVEQLKDEKEVGFQAGYGQAGGTEMELGLGPMGAQVLVIEVAGERTAYVLYDANGVGARVRNPLFKAFEARVDHLILCTSDNHYLNTIRNAHNPLGHSGQWERVVELGLEALEKALADMGPAEAGLGMTMVKEEMILGPGNTYRITSLVNSIAASCRTAWIPLYGGASLVYWVVARHLVKYV